MLGLLREGEGQGLKPEPRANHTCTARRGWRASPWAWRWGRAPVSLFTRWHWPSPGGYSSPLCLCPPLPGKQKQGVHSIRLPAQEHDPPTPAGGSPVEPPRGVKPRAGTEVSGRASDTHTPHHGDCT